MRIVSDIKEMRRKRRPIVMAAGFFDGVHRGHKKVLSTAMERAGALGGEGWCLTFDQHPKKILSPHDAPRMLTSLKHRMELFERVGIDGCIVLPFNKELATMTPDQFSDLITGSVPALREILVGSNWRFGSRGAGTPALLAKAGAAHGLVVSIARAVKWNGDFVSSTRIRKEVCHGHLDSAAQMLGRHFSLLGTVARGRTIGRQLGYPTANIDPHNEVVPPYGVFAVKALMQGAVHNGVLNHGVRPTFEDDGSTRPTLELHLFDFDSDIYGVDVEVFFYERIRSEEKFTDHEALKAQIKSDSCKAKSILTKYRKLKLI